MQMHFDFACPCIEWCLKGFLLLIRGKFTSSSQIKAFVQQTGERTERLTRCQLLGYKGQECIKQQMTVHKGEELCTVSGRRHEPCELRVSASDRLVKSSSRAHLSFKPQL